jgi:nicotinate-nucleotide adenylyltransferase
MKIGIFGGTFDPIHLGHLLLAEQALEAVPLDEVWFVPAGEPPHKRERVVTPAFHRLRMVELATREHPRFRVSDLEVKRQGPSYTVHTIEALKAAHPQHHFFLLVGADMVKDLPNWYKTNKIIQHVQILALGRPGVETGDIPAEIRERLTWIEGAAETNISSSLIRRRLAAGKSVRYLLPEPVYQYVKEHRLYGT